MKENYEALMQMEIHTGFGHWLVVQLEGELSAGIKLITGPLLKGPLAIEMGEFSAELHNVSGLAREF